MERKLVSADIISMKPSMMDYELEQPLFEDRKLLTNSVKLHKGFTYCQDINMMLSGVETEDNKVGISDENLNYGFLDYNLGQTFWKMFKQDAFNKYGENNEDMLYYWNFIMANEGRNSKRVKYNLIQITE